jgi:hypothetical protein
MNGRIEADLERLRQQHAEHTFEATTCGAP